MTSFRICIQNIRKWGSNARVKMCLVLAVMFVFSFTSGMGDVCHALGEKMNPWIFPFLFTYRYMKIILMMPLLFIFCDAPFIDGNQVYVMLRTNRRSWCVGQILYVIVSSFLYTMLLLISSVLFNLGNMQWGTTWGVVLGKSAMTSIVSSLGKSHGTIRISSMVVRYYKPYQAMILSFLLMWLSFMFIGLIIYVLNVISKTQLAGTLTAGVLILFTAVADLRAKFVKYSPISWNSLNNVDVANVTAFPKIDFVLLTYICIIIILIIFCIIVGKRQEIIVREEE